MAKKITFSLASNSRDSPRFNVICSASLSSALTLNQTSSIGAVSCTRIAPAGSGVGLGVGDAVSPGVGLPGGLEDGDAVDSGVALGVGVTLGEAVVFNPATALPPGSETAGVKYTQAA